MKMTIFKECNDENVNFLSLTEHEEDQQVNRGVPQSVEIGAKIDVLL